MSDSTLMLNLLQGSSRQGSATLFKDSQLRDLIDQANPGYSNGQAVWDLKNVDSDMLALSQSSLLIPYSIGINGVLTATNCLGAVTVPGLAAAGGPPTFLNGIPSDARAPLVGGTLNVASQCSLAYKSSSLDIVTGLNVGIASSNSSIVSEINHLSLLNQIKLAVQTNKDWLEIFGPRLCFALDTKKTVTIGDATSGFATRQKYLYSQSTIEYYPLTGALVGDVAAYISRIQCVAVIPLHLLHNFFGQLDSPQRGINYRINTMFAREFSQQSVVNAFVFAGAAPTTRPTYSICGPGGSSVNVGGASWSSCVLKYRSITLPPEIQARYDSDILDGKVDTQYIDYVVQDTYDSQYNSSGSLKSFQVATGVVKPLKLWAMAFVPGCLSSNTALRVTSLAFQSLNAKVGTTNRYVTPLSNGFDMYNELSQQFQELALSLDKGSLLTYRDFYPGSELAITGQSESGLAHFACLDLARVQNRVVDAAISLQLDAVRVGSTPADFIVIVERAQVCRQDRTRNTVSVVVGSVLD